MTDKDFAKEIKELKDNLDAAKTKQYKFEARMDELKKKRKRLLEELESCGVKPEELEEEIKNLEDDSNTKSI